MCFSERENIKTVTTYGYTTEDTPTGGTTQTYNYINGTDKLSSITGSSNFSDDISYDLAGNPLQWKGKVLQWNRGRRLTCYGDISYTYDAGGIRQSKTVGTETHTYYTEDSRIHKEEYRGRKLLYGYDESGIATIECNGQIYYMQKNFQGDIVGLVDGTKKVVAKYVYDAWGNHKVYDANNNESTSANFIGHINPFRYRGYYYDGETGLYYLQTRYYDPSIGRFLSADSVDYADPESFNGFNLYAYCGNNPVMLTDSTGCSSFWDKLWGWVATAAITLVGVGLIVATGGLAAAGIIAANGLAASVMVGAGVGILAGVGGSIIAQGGLTNIGNVNPWSVAVSGLIGGAIGAASGAASFGFAQIGQAAGQSIGFALSNARHIGTGVKIAKVFGVTTSSLMKAGLVVGGFAGGAAGGFAANYMANKLVADTFGTQYMVDNPNYVRSGILKFFQWMYPFA